MAELETVQETKPEDVQISHADLLIAIGFPFTSNLLPQTVAKLAEGCQMLPAQYETVLALPGDSTHDESTLLGAAERPARPLRFVNYPMPAIDPAAIPWLPNAGTYQAASSLASQLGARACTFFGTDLSLKRESLTVEKLSLLLDPAIEGSFDLVMPLYTTQAFDDLVNKSILYPLTRTLYGHRVRNPLGNEFQMSAKLFPALSANGNKDSARQQGRLPWLATVAANQNLKICQAQLGNRRPPSADGIELSDALSQLVSPLFLDMEDNAAFWQRIRGSHDVPTFGSPDSLESPTDAVDVRHMTEAFQLGVRNLREIWSLVLPPVTLLELKKLSIAPPDQFHMADSLWTRIVYDFALAHRLRNIHRSHLFGAFTPLYLGWVASYAVEINRTGIAAAEERVEQLARAYESEKPYLLSRWRWPDRFHP